VNVQFSSVQISRESLCAVQAMKLNWRHRQLLASSNGKSSNEQLKMINFNTVFGSMSTKLGTDTVNG